MKSLLYTDWYFYNFSTRGFDNNVAFTHTVGARPSPTFSLTRVNINNRKAKGEPLTADNFVWVTKAAVKAAREGRLTPPVFPADTRTPKEQKINDIRFQQHVQPMIDYHTKQKQKWAKIDKWQSDLGLLMDNITTYVVSKGYDAHDAMNPEVLPSDTHPKLNAARILAQRLMAYINNPELEAKHKDLNRLLASKGKARQDRDPTKAANRVYSGKRGRPYERLIQQKVRISDLTPEQKQHLGILLHQDYYTVDTPKRKNQKVWTVLITVPNPKLQSNQSQNPAQEAA